MFEICSPVTLPNFKDLYDLSLPCMPWPPRIPDFPTLPTLSMPIFGLPSLPGIPPLPNFGTLRIPNFEVVMSMIELQAAQLLSVIKAMIQPILDFLSLSVDIIPKIPTLNISLDDLLTFDFTKIYTKMYDMIMSFIPTIEFPNIQKWFSYLWDLIPYPMYYDMNAPEIELVNTVKILVKQYMNMLIDFLKNLIDSAVQTIMELFKVVIPSLPTLPKLPTLQEIYNMILSMLPQFPNIKSIIFSGLSIPNIFNNLSFPSFTLNLGLPTIIIPNFKMPEIDFIECFNILYNELLLTPLKTIYDFIMNTLKRYIPAFEASWPKICISI